MRLVLLRSLARVLLDVVCMQGGKERRDWSGEGRVCGQRGVRVYRSVFAGPGG